MQPHTMIVIGASAGGLDALKTLISGLPADLPAAVCIVWHVAPDGPNLLPQLLQQVSALPITHAVDQMFLHAGHVYVAPPDRHLVVERQQVRLTHGPKENRFRPAVDVLFRSAALAWGAAVIGVVLTGRLDDGTAGLWAIKDQGGIAVVQHPEDALYPSMPQSARRHVAVDYCLPLSELASLLVRLSTTLRQPEGAPVDDELKIENAIAQEGNALALGIMQLGPVSPYTCPECHGVLVRLKTGGITRFRCHTGHAYSLDTLLLEVTEAVEANLWGALRAIEETMLLLEHAASHAEAAQENLLAKQYRAEALAASQRARLVREAVLAHSTLSRATLKEVDN